MRPFRAPERRRSLRAIRDWRSFARGQSLCAQKLDASLQAFAAEAQARRTMRLVQSERHAVTRQSLPAVWDFAGSRKREPERLPQAARCLEIPGGQRDLE